MENWRLNGFLTGNEINLKIRKWLIISWNLILHQLLFANIIQITEQTFNTKTLSLPLWTLHCKCQIHFYLLIIYVHTSFFENILQYIIVFSCWYYKKYHFGYHGSLNNIKIEFAIFINRIIEYETTKLCISIPKIVLDILKLSFEFRLRNILLSVTSNIFCSQ